jgi:hypothetical protein
MSFCPLSWRLDSHASFHRQSGEHRADCCAMHVHRPSDKLHRPRSTGAGAGPIGCRRGQSKVRELPLLFWEHTNACCLLASSPKQELPRCYSCRRASLPARNTTPPTSARWLRRRSPATLPGGGLPGRRILTCIMSHHQDFGDSICVRLQLHLSSHSPNMQGRPGPHGHQSPPSPCAIVAAPPSVFLAGASATPRSGVPVRSAAGCTVAYAYGAFPCRAAVGAFPRRRARVRRRRRAGSG